jgi:2,4-dienoyl-CoA reductase-like NADH-dependent reductase (Old Yellow Enzyme family)/thioredoxin reductase
MASKDPLLQPFQLKHLTLRNRFMSTAHEPNYHHDGMPQDQYRLYHVEKAKGGIALTMTAGSAIVSADSPPAFGNLHAYKDEIVAPMKRLTDEVKEHGSAVMIQITHLGRRANWNHSDWLPVLSPSPVREPAHRTFPKEMEDWDIERIIKDYADAAQRMQAGGMDGIEFEAYGHLMDGFWSPLTNQRDDEYGMQSLDNRLRFTNRVLDAVRAAVGPDFIVGIRLVCDEDYDRGLSREDGIEISKRLVATGQIDFLNVIRGRIDSDAHLTGVIPIGGMPSAPHLDFSGEVRAATKFPVFHAARIADVATARHAIAEGKLDMVGMTRAHIADPHIALKTAQGREHEIRPCVGATYCLDRIYEGNGTLCIHNPATGREATMPHIISRSDGLAKKVVIVGAGPAGLEAARVAGERGHDVTVFEAANDPGGQIRLATQLKRRAELIGIIDWRVERCEAVGVEFRFNTYAEADDVRALSPDVVVIATGGLPQCPPMDAGEELAVSSWDILSGDVKPAENVLLFDDNGQHPGLTAAEFIARAGSTLEVVTPERFFAPDIGGLNHVPYAKAFHETGTTITINTYVKALRRDGNKITARLFSDYTGADIGERVVDQIVVEHGTLPLDEIYFALKDESVNRGEVDYPALIVGRRQEISRNRDGAFQLFRIGDAVASRNIHAAIYDALRLVKDF